MHAALPRGRGANEGEEHPPRGGHVAQDGIAAGYGNGMRRDSPIEVPYDDGRRGHAAEKFRRAVDVDVDVDVAVGVDVGVSGEDQFAKRVVRVVRIVVVVVVVVVAGGNAQRELERPVGDAAVVATDQAGGTGTGADAAGLVDAYQGPVAGSGDQRGGGQERHRVVGSR